MAAGSESCRPEAVPKGAAPEVAKVLQASSWYAVLDVLPSATVEEIRKAHKVKSLVTHPDKLGAKNSGAHEASVRVNTVGLPCFSLLRLACDQHIDSSRCVLWSWADSSLHADVSCP